MQTILMVRLQDKMLGVMAINSCYPLLSLSSTSRVIEKCFHISFIEWTEVWTNLQLQINAWNILMRFECNNKNNVYVKSWQKALHYPTRFECNNNIMSKVDEMHDNNIVDGMDRGAKLYVKWISEREGS